MFKTLIFIIKEERNKKKSILCLDFVNDTSPIILYILRNNNKIKKISIN